MNGDLKKATPMGAEKQPGAAVSYEEQLKKSKKYDILLLSDG